MILVICGDCQHVWSLAFILMGKGEAKCPECHGDKIYCAVRK